ncbi:hypothetical protein LZZ85_28190 [Terrimonas sp. NA20]|uniref:Uncharacterized protein n=1 Tax=Terrimonas ginsenosidimutans TaxID=2908004 RepID=A0ABS9L125_9BACT|nr:hypothetical protein [Terrimonas ginsenosidimutans]MCG2618208.1 hypothetical protein [Terrimonas ginsenosidimutans]
MKRIVKGLFTLVFLWAFQFSSFSQEVTGIWRGYFIGSGGDRYRLEFQVGQSPSGKVSIKGVSYSWQDDKRFYGKATMTGSYVSDSKNFRIHEIQTVEVQNPLGGTCIMNYDLVYSRSGREEFLEGTYLGKPEVKGRENPYPWGECGGGRVFLRKVPTTEFYLEPFLRDTKIAVTPKPLITKPQENIPADNTTTNNNKTNATPNSLTTNKKNTSSPAPKTTTPKVTTPNTTKTTTSNTTKSNTTAKQPAVKPQKPPVVQKPVSKQPKDSAVAKVTTVPPREPEKPTIAVIKPPVSSVPVPEVLKTRQNELMKALVVNDPNVTVKIFDNGEIDGDTISVYLDKRLVLSKKMLTAAPLTLSLKMDEENPEHELVMVAENLGRIPPNTSLMIVEAGRQRFEVRITSTEQKNALVRFRYEKP